MRAVALFLLLAVAGGCVREHVGDGIPLDIDASQFGERAGALIHEHLEVARAKPGDGTALGRAAMVLHAYGILEAALGLYRRAAQLEPDNVRWAYLQGIVAADLGQLVEAEQALRLAVRVEPFDLAASLRLADTVLRAGRPSEALTLYRKLEASQPGQLAVHLGLGKALSELGRDRESVTALERAASLTSGYRPLYYHLALALRGAGRENEADAWVALFDRLPAEPRLPFADPVLKEIESLRDGSYLHHLNRGMAFESVGQLDRALQEYEAAIAVDSEQVHAHVNRISVFGRTGRPEKARAAYHEVLDIHPEVAEAHYNWGVLQSQLGEHSEAEAAFRRTLQINPYFSDARLNLGDALERQGMAEVALEQFRHVLRANPGHSLAHFRLGLALHRSGRSQEALAHLQRAAETRDERAAQFLVVLARAERDLGLGAQAAGHAAAARAIAQRNGQSDVLAILDREFPRAR